MLYARVVLGLAVEGPFDYSVPASLDKKINTGMRVWVQFRTQRMLGYVVKTTRKTNIQNLKPILEVIDESPVLDTNMLSLTRELSNYYGCSWGEVIETALPEGLRKGKRITGIRINNNLKTRDNQEVILIHDLEGKGRWDIYLNAIKETLNSNKTAIVLLPDLAAALKAKKTIADNLDILPAFLYRKQPKELEEWLKIREGKFNIIIGTRSAIFAPVNNLGLVIIDEEEDSVYKQDQVPHYHAREAAFMRINIEKARLILGSLSPSMETIHLARQEKIKYAFLPRKRTMPEVKTIDMRSQQYSSKERNTILSRPLEDCIIQTLNAKGKILLFLNRRGFATFATCRHCGTVLKCPRCNVNLVYYFKDSILNCHYCNFKMPAVKICPSCNSGYIRYLGSGTEKIESELSRIFPQARIKRLDNVKNADIEAGDIFIATQAIIKETDYHFDLIGVLSIDNSLNRIDFRAAEKTFALLVRLLGLTKEKVLIQTRITKHYCFKALENKDINIFYDEELKYRKQLGFPPYRYLCLVKLRGRKEERVKEVSEELFNRLTKFNKNNKSIRIVAINPGQPSKLRGNFYWQILMKGSSPLNMVKFLKLHLKNFAHSGIIVTIDVDPI